MINRRIVVSAMSIVTALSLMTGATFAYFSDVASTTGNTFSTGNADLQIAVDAAGTPGTYENSIPGAVINNIAPGFQERYLFWLKNNSTASIALSLTGDLANLGGSFHGTDGSLPNKLLVKWTCDTDDNGIGIGTDTVSGEFSVTDWINGGNASLGNLAQGADVQCSMNVRLDPSAGNEIAGGNISFDGVYNATQVAP